MPATACAEQVSAALLTGGLVIPYAHLDIFDLHELVKPILGVFPAQARLLHTSEGCNLTGDANLIHTNHAILQCFSSLPRPLQILRHVDNTVRPNQGA